MVGRKIRAVLLDIDGTLIEREQLVWTGGELERWSIFLNQIKEVNLAQGYETVFGIATFKKEPDAISNKVLGLGEFSDKANLAGFISEDFIYFTNAECKIEHALRPTLAKLQATHPDTTEADIFIIDDLYKEVLIHLKRHGFNGFHAIGFSKGFDMQAKAQTVEAFMSSVLNCFQNNEFPAPQPKVKKPLLWQASHSKANTGVRAQFGNHRQIPKTPDADSSTSKPNMSMGFH